MSYASTPLDPGPTYLASDRRTLPSGRFTLVRIPVDPIAHTFRPGTRLRIVISAPGGDRPSWTFDTPATHDSVVDTVALKTVGGSSLVVNEVEDVVPTSAMPACGALRGEPCRAYTPSANRADTCAAQGDVTFCDGTTAEDPEVHDPVGDPELLQVLLEGLLRVRPGTGLRVQELGRRLRGLTGREEQPGGVRRRGHPGGECRAADVERGIRTDEWTTSARKSRSYAVQ